MLILEYLRRDKQKSLILISYSLLIFFLLGNYKGYLAGELDFWILFEFWVLVVYAAVITLLVIIDKHWGVNGYFVKNKVAEIEIIPPNKEQKIPKYPKPTPPEVVSSVTRGLIIVFNTIFIECLIILVVHVVMEIIDLDLLKNL
ncbi:hypothetical protein IV53_GL000072 [Ligilactobacillus ceti DSM 22408]|uniref:Uncharacterized protein n=1 Tax=Ligilactobacillus ceti DSM 22408 TaxID=1122146 RepID=A0A0R2KJH8_9LACO|nr:hypothetical protein [Ligilactobacillus ceti]KRN89355.1 hypothetical protein IV53_GL000072 [Ligilactobacillus ceti DSM 22408]